MGVAARFATVLASALTVLAFAVPIANAAQAPTQLCSNTTGGWTTVTDEQGVSWLVPAGQTGCTTTESTCSSAAALGSPYPGWVFVVDDIGVPWLYPAGSVPLAVGGNCTQSQTTAPREIVGSAPTPQATASPYPGWVVVTDDQGVPWLEPTR
jgi:hypothetical protein